MRSQIGELVGKNIVVYDLEIKNLVGSVVDGKKIGWDNHDKMGISCGVAYHYKTGDYTVFMDDNIQELGRLLNQAEMVVAFNQVAFDNPLLRASGVDLKSDSGLNNFDMLEESRLAIGWTPSQRFPRGCKLDDHLKATFGADFMKTEHGSEAPKMYQEGRIGELISYCLADVARERALFEYIWVNGIAFTESHGVHHFVNHPRKSLT